MAMRRTVRKENKDKTGSVRKVQDRHSWKKLFNKHFTILIELPHPLVPLNQHIAQVFHHDTWLGHPHFAAIVLVVCFLLLSSNI